MINDINPPDRPPRRAQELRLQPPERPVVPPLHEQARAIDPSFKTPEQTASEQPSPFLPMVIHHHEASAAQTKQAKHHQAIGWLRSLKNIRLTRQQQIIGSALAVVLLLGVGTGWTVTHHKPAANTSATKRADKLVPPTPPPVIYSTLTGLPVADETVNKRTVTGVMIENSLDARPQSGLSEAGVVFEAVAEGGVTRFLALFQDTAPDNIGPIRSARPYYVQWALGFDAAYGHVGGSPDALNDIKAWGVKDMNQFSNGGSYHRITTRPAPHNVYTSVTTLNQLEAAKGYTSTYTGFTRNTKEAAVTPPTATSVDFHLSGRIYDPHYDYNATTNSYDRTENAAPHLDANTGKQISPKVVIAIVVPLARGALDSSGAYYSDYNTIGSGQAYIFQNGTATIGTWTKPGNNANIAFTDANGQPLPLNPGQTWISAVSAANAVIYK